MGLELKWNGPELEVALHRATYRGLLAGGVHLHTKEKLAISVPVVKVQVTRTRNTSRGAKGSTYMKVIERSKLGEPPRLDTGFGRDNIVFEGSEPDMAVRVGIRQNAMYMFKHEVTGRSHLRRTLMEEQQAIAKIIETFAVDAMEKGAAAPPPSVGQSAWPGFKPTAWEAEGRAPTSTEFNQVLDEMFLPEPKKK